MFELFENAPYTFSYIVEHLYDLPLGTKIRSDRNDFYELKEQIENGEKVRKFSRINNTNLRFMTYDNIDMHFYLVQEELLTDQEKEFLKDIIKYYENITKIEFGFIRNGIDIYDKDNNIIASISYPYNLDFQYVCRNVPYTLKELGLED